MELGHWIMIIGVIFMIGLITFFIDILMGGDRATIVTKKTSTQEEFQKAKQEKKAQHWKNIGLGWLAFIFIALALVALFD